MSRKPLSAVLVIALTFVAAACGDGGDRDGDADIAEPTSETAEATTPPTTEASATPETTVASAEESSSAAVETTAAPTTVAAEVDPCEGVTLEATDVGITEDTLIVEVMGDTGSAAIPGLANGAIESVQKWAELMNEQGGLGCRQVEVRTYDSKLTPDEARNGYIDGCQNAFAMVGTTALSVADAQPLLECADMTGAATGLPEVPGLALLPVHSCNPTSFPVYGSGQPCPPQTGVRDIQIPNAVGKYLGEQWGPDAHGLYLVPTTAAVYSESVIPAMRYYQENFGLTADIEAGANGRDPQSAYTPAATAMRDAGSNFAYGASTWPSFLLMQKEAEVQGVENSNWYCQSACYDPAYLEAGGATTVGTIVSLSFLPYEEADVNEEVKTFTERVETVNSFGLNAWVAARLFEKAVTDLVAAEGPNALTRANLLESLSAIKDFDANGMVSPSTPSARVGAECAVFVQVQEDLTFKRIFPEEPGTFSCEGYGTISIDPSTAFAG